MLTPGLSSTIGAFESAYVDNFSFCFCLYCFERNSFDVRKQIIHKSQKSPIQRQMQTIHPEAVRHRCKPRARLTEDQVLDIFKLKGSSKYASQLGALHGVSEKTVRDIWTGRTWSLETHHLDTSRPIVIKNPGRPKGSKDSKPRKQKGQSVQNHLRQSHQSLGSNNKHSLPRSTTPCELSIDESYVHDNRSDCDFKLWTGPQGPASHISASMRRSSVDDELHEWKEQSWCSPRTDPFRRDWNPALLARKFMI